MYTAQSHDRYARAFVYQRVREVFDILDSKSDGQLDEQELLSHLWSVGYHASKNEVHDMIWEVDDRSTGVITLEAIRKLLKRLQKAKKRMPGTGTNLLRTLIEFMMFDSDGSAEIELEEIQQMFYVYYGYKGLELDEKVQSFSRMRAPEKLGCEIDFTEFLKLMDSLGLVPVVGEHEGVKAPRPPCVPRLRNLKRSSRALRSPRGPKGSVSAREPYPDSGPTLRLPKIITPRVRPNERELSEIKFRHIEKRFQASRVADLQRQREEDKRQQEEAPRGMLTIRNAMMK